MGCETALFIAEKGTMSPDTAFFLLENMVIDLEEALIHTNQGRSVIIVEMLDRIGADFGGSHRLVNKQNLRKHNIEMMTKTRCLEITEKGIVILENGDRKTIEADTVVLAT